MPVQKRMALLGLGVGSPIFKGSLEVKLPTIWRVEQQSLEVQTSENCTRLQREAHLQVNVLKKKYGLGPFFFDVGMSKNCRKWHAAVAPSAFTSQNGKARVFCTTFDR